MCSLFIKNQMQEEIREIWLISAMNEMVRIVRLRRNHLRALLDHRILTPIEYFQTYGGIIHDEEDITIAEVFIQG